MMNQPYHASELRCQQISALLLPYLHDDLPSPEREAVARHLASCAACRAELEETRAIERDLRESAARRHPAMDPRVSARLQQRLYQEMRKGLFMKRAFQFVTVLGALAILALVAALVIRQVGRPAHPQPGAKSTPASDVPARLTVADTDPVLPDPSIVNTLLRAPLAWKVTTGQGVKVAVIQNHTEDLSLLSAVAPGSAVVPIQADNRLLVNGRPLAQELARQGIRLLALIQPDDFDPQALRETVKDMAAAGVAVFVNADLTPGQAQVELVNDLEAAGAIIIGQVSIDGIVLGSDIKQRRIDLFAPYGWPAKNRDSALAAAGVGALVLAQDPALSAAALKQRLVDTADPMWQASNPDTGAWDPMKISVDPRTGDYSAAEGAYHYLRVNAARALGVTLDIPWPVNALNAPAAWQRATGKGVRLAILDQGFHVDNPAFRGRLVDKAAFVPGKDFTGAQNFHGTSMAKIALSIAPDASLVFLLTDERADQSVKDAYVRAIDYAIAHHVRVISNSSGPWANTPEIHAAIDRAVQAGIVFVWFHYQGANPAVIRPGYYWQSQWEVGAFDRFFDRDKPADLEGGLSETAPQIAGIAALILQNEPDLAPMQVKRRILETAVQLPNGCSLADAAAAVENRPSGRKAAWLDAPRPSGSRVTIVYSKADQKEKATLTVKDTGAVSPVPLLPGRNIMLYSVRNQLPSEPMAILYATGEDGGSILNLGFYPGDPLAADTLKGGYIHLVVDNQSYLIDISKGQPRLTMSVNGSRLRLHWENPDGEPLPVSDPLNGTPGGQTGALLYEIDAEGDFLPLPVLFTTGY